MHADDPSVFDRKPGHGSLGQKLRTQTARRVCISHGQPERIDLTARGRVQGAVNIPAELGFERARLFGRNHADIHTALALLCHDLGQDIPLHFILDRLQTAAAQTVLNVLSQLLAQRLKHGDRLDGKVHLRAGFFGVVADHAVGRTGCTAGHVAPLDDQHALVFLCQLPDHRTAHDAAADYDHVIGLTHRRPLQTCRS